MWAAELLWALGLALLVGGIFWSLMRPGRVEGASGIGFWAMFWLFCVIFLGTWAIGAWVEPVGPIWWGVAWLPFLFAALLIGLLLAAAAGMDWGSSRRHYRRDASGESHEFSTASGAATRSEDAETAAAAISIFVWFILFLAMIALFARYVILAE